MGYYVLETDTTMEINLVIHSISSPSKHRFYLIYDELVNPLLWGVNKFPKVNWDKTAILGKNE